MVPGRAGAEARVHRGALERKEARGVQVQDAPGQAQLLAQGHVEEGRVVGVHRDRDAEVPQPADRVGLGAGDRDQGTQPFSASAPLTISMSSLVM